MDYDTTTGYTPVRRYCMSTGRMCEYATEFGYCQLTACVKHADWHDE